MNMNISPIVKAAWVVSPQQQIMQLFLDNKHQSAQGFK